MRSLYSVLSPSATIEEVVLWIADITRDRANDVSDYETQEAVHTSIYPVPSSMTDLRGTEKVGDIAVATGYLYVVVDDAGDLEWRRVALTTF